MLELLRTNRISELKISELVRTAGVSRMAFYRNYESLKQVLMEYYEPKFADIFNKIANKKNHEQKIRDLTSFFLTFSDDFRLSGFPEFFLNNKKKDSSKLEWRVVYCLFSFPDSNNNLFN